MRIKRNSRIQFSFTLQEEESHFLLYRVPELKNKPSPEENTVVQNIKATYIPRTSHQPPTINLI